MSLPSQAFDAITHVFPTSSETVVIAFNHINRVPLVAFYVAEIGYASSCSASTALTVQGPFSEDAAVAKCQEIVSELEALDKAADAAPADEIIRPEGGEQA